MRNTAIVFHRTMFLLVTVNSYTIILHRVLGLEGYTSCFIAVTKDICMFVNIFIMNLPISIL